MEEGELPGVGGCQVGVRREVVSGVDGVDLQEVVDSVVDGVEGVRLAVVVLLEVEVEGIKPLNSISLSVFISLTIAFAEFV